MSKRILLIDSDEQLVGQSEFLRSMLDGRAGAWILANIADLRAGLAAIQATLMAHGAVLFGRTT